jgi:cytochrome c-type biogenesis protein CcmE
MVTRWRIVVVLALVAGGLGWVAAKSLGGNLVYFRTPTEIVRRAAAGVGERIRVGGQVVPGTIQRLGDQVRFVITDRTTRLTVVDTGGVPSLFGQAQGVVVEGALGADGAFHADTVLVKHSDSYRPPAPGETPHSADVEGG